MTEIEIAIESVRVDGRHRKDLGDVEGLARSIDREGLIHAIVITPDGRLLAGERRLAAMRLLGREQIAARVVDTLGDALAGLRIERDENTQRKAMTPEELVRLGKALEELERPRAAARQGTRTDLGRQLPGHVTRKLSDQVAAEPSGPTREIVAEALGMSSTTYDRAKTVVAFADDPSATPEDQKIAKGALADMNATGNIAGNYEKVRKLRDSRVGAPHRHVIEEIRKQRRAIDTAVHGLAGITYALNQIQIIHPNVSSDEAAQWVDGLSDARRALEGLIKRLKEHINGQA